MSLCRTLKLTLLVGLSGALHVAGESLVISAGNGPSLISDNSGTVGALFEVGTEPLAVMSLGLLDDGSAGLDQPHSVGLWMETGALLARVDFSPGSSGFGANGFVYQNLSSPVLLQPGTRYVLGVDYQTGMSDRLRVNNSFDGEAWSPFVNFSNGRYTEPTAGFAFPEFNVFGQSYVGANAQVVVVPEPGVVALLLCSTVTLLRRRTGLRRIFKRACRYRGDGGAAAPAATRLEHCCKVD